MEADDGIIPTRDYVPAAEVVLAAAGSMVITESSSNSSSQDTHVSSFMSGGVSQSNLLLVELHQERDLLQLRSQDGFDIGFSTLQAFY